MRENLRQATDIATQLQDRKSLVRQQVRESAGQVGSVVAPGRSIRRSARAFQQAGSAAGRERRTASMTLAALAEIPGVPQPIAQQAAQVRQRLVTTERNAAERQQELQRIRSQMKKTALFIFITALAIAGIADLLSIADLGWLADIVFVPVTYAIARRTLRINRGGDMAVAAQAAAHRNITVLQQRLRPAIVAGKRTDLSQALVGQQVANIGVRFSSYMRQFVVLSVGVQITELIPILDWLPFYIGQVVKMMTDQYKAYRMAAQVLSPLQRSYALLERLEAFEIETMNEPLAEYVNAYQDELLRIVQSEPAFVA